MKRTLFALGAALYAQAVFAADAVWTKIDTATEYWTNTAYWVDSIGDPLNVYPDGPNWGVRLTPLAAGAAHAHKIQIGDLDDGTAGSLVNEPHEYEVRSIEGSERHTLNLYSKHSLLVNPVYFTIENPTGFLGYWTSENPRAVLRIPGVTDDEPPVVHNFSAARRGGIAVTDVVGKVRVDQLYGSGLLEKHGPGELVVASTTGSGNRVNLNGGRLTLEGMDWPDEPVGTPYVWLDASVEASLLKTEDEGRLAVTNWVDRRGASPDRPSATVIEGRRAPFISAETANGFHLVDFGARDASNVATLGPTNCVLKFPSGMANRVREVFAVYRILDFYDAMTFPVGDSSYYPFHATTRRLLQSTNADQGAKYGDVAWNGDKIDPLNDTVMADDQSRLHVVSVGIRGNPLTSLNLVGSDRLLKERIGGMRVAEILYYTNELTHLERASVNRYLKKKWLDASNHPRYDVGVVNLASNDVEIAVAAGCSASVGTLVSHADRIVKSGSGTLTVGKVLPEDAPIEVRAGSVVFAAPAAVTAQPAVNPYLWLDATVEGSFVPQEGNGEDGPEYVTQWKDRRLDRASPVALFPGSANPNFTANAPWLVRNSPFAHEGRTVVDFGELTKTTDTRTWMWLDVRDAANAFEGFIALRFKEVNRVVNIFGSSDQMMTRNEIAQLVSYKFGGWRSATALWTKDGVPSDPWDGTHGAYPTNRFMVFSISSTDRLWLDYIAKDRNASGAAGGVEIGEFISYERRLSDGERRATIDYLMQKWEGVPSPLSSGVSSVKSLAYADDATITVGSDGALAVESVTGGNGAFVKTGSGDVSLGSLPADRSFSAVSVEEGTLSLDFSFVDDSLFHFDAMDAASVAEYTVTGSEAEGNLKTNVTKWADTRGLDKGYAYSLKGRYAAVADPTLVSVETRPGVFRPCMDFGAYAGKTDDAVDSAAFRFDRSYMTVKEAYIIYADRGNRNGFIFADHSAYDYHRGGAGSMVSASNGPKVNRGYAIVDGERTTPDSVLADGMHLIAFINDAEETTSIDQLSKDRDNAAYRCGGNRVCEALAFDRHLSDAERTYLVQKLMAKWFDDEAPSVNKEIASLSLGKGGTFTSPGLDLTVPVLSGSGTVNVDSVAGVTTLNVACDPATGTFSPIVVNGGFAFAEEETIKLNVSAGDVLPAGDYAVLTAPGLDGVDLSRVDVEVTPEQRRRVVSAKVKDGSLVLSVRKRGLIIEVR